MPYYNTLRAKLPVCFLLKNFAHKNPKQTFEQILNSNQEAKNAMDLINQYGNGDPKAAFQNYAVSTGKQSWGQQIKDKFGLK